MAGTAKIVEEQIRKAGTDTKEAERCIKDNAIWIDDLMASTATNLVRLAKSQAIKSRVNGAMAKLLVADAVVKNAYQTLNALSKEARGHDRYGVNRVLWRLGEGDDRSLRERTIAKQIQMATEEGQALVEALRSIENNCRSNEDNKKTRKRLSIEEELEDSPMKKKREDIDEPERSESKSNAVEETSEFRRCQGCVNELNGAVKDLVKQLRRVPEREYAKPEDIELDNQGRNISCSYCKNGHRSDKCFVEKKVSRRLEIVSKRKTCKICLRHSDRKRCTEEISNSCRYCKGKDHHQSLCTFQEKLEREIEHLKEERRRMLLQARGEYCDHHSRKCQETHMKTKNEKHSEGEVSSGGSC